MDEGKEYMTIWSVMRVFNEERAYYQVFPYSTSVLRVLLRMNHGLGHVACFIWNGRWSEKNAYKLANKKNMH